MFVIEGLGEEGFLHFNLALGTPGSGDPRLVHPVVKEFSVAGMNVEITN